MKQILPLLLIWLAMACSMSGNVTPANPANALVGTWRLTTYCKPTGTSTCATVSVPADKRVFVSFDNDGTFSEFYENTKPIDYGFLGCGGGSYKIEGNDVRIFASCMSLSTGQLVKLVSVSDTRLVLNPYGTGESVLVK